MLSDRLRAVAAMVPEAKTIADIGCDHGKLALWLLKNGRVQYAVCSDISAPSLEKARKLAETMGLQKAVSLRVGSGFDVLKKGEADTAVIAGMGGVLMTSILEQGKDRLPETLVLACQRDPDVLRGWLVSNGFVISDEDIVLENRHYYPVIRAEKGPSIPLTDAELEFGPVLLVKKPEMLKGFVAQRIKQTKRIRSALTVADAANKHELLNATEARLRLYEEVLKCL